MLPLAGLRHFLFSHRELSSARSQPHDGFPAVPPSLNVYDHDMRGYADQNVPPNTIPRYTPYLGLRARLSQVWINRWTILLALIIARLLLSLRDINYDVQTAKREALAACTGVEKVGSAMASMPHYLSDGVNSLAADGVTKAVSGLRQMLMLTITGVEEIVLFVINMMTSTYICLLTLAISGSLHVAIDMIEEVGDFMNKSISSITGGMTGDLKSFQDGLNGFLRKINIGGLLGSSRDPPQIDLSSQIAALNKIQIPTDKLDADLAKLNSSIPTFDEVKNFTDNAIKFPFELLKKTLNSSMAGYTFDKSVFPPAKKQILTFCSDNDGIEKFFVGLFNVLHTAKKVILIVLVILAVLACVPMAAREIWAWRSMQKRSVMVQRTSFDPIDVLYIASRPYTATAGIKLASRFKGTKKQILMRWFVAYITTFPALFVLALGMAGLFTCLCQYLVLKAIEREVPALAADVGDFTEKVVVALTNASEGWANSANSVIKSTNSKINDDVFGWAVNASFAVNNTLNAFTDEMGKALNDTFGGTILYKPITEVLHCLIGLKIAGIESGLTWVTENAHVSFPTFRSDVFSSGAESSVSRSAAPTDSFLSSPGNVASDDITNAVLKVTHKLAEGIKIEAIISLFIICIWLFVVLIGAIRVLIAWRSHDKTRAEGGVAGYANDNAPITPPPNPYDNQPPYQQQQQQEQRETPFPRFGGPVSAAHTGTGTPWQADEFGADEKIGAGGQRSVEEGIKPGHVRESSYGYLEGKR